MALFDTTKKRLEALEREVISHPTPQNMVSLVEKYIASGDERKALEVAKKAMERFPDSELCVSSYQNVRKTQLQHKIQDLNAQIRKSPNPSYYERLAKLYLDELGNRNKAYETAMEGLTKFASSDGLHYIAGEVRMTRFHNDYLANDATEAIRHFSEAHQGNPQNIKALIDLARMYAEVGEFTKANETIDKALALDSNIPTLTAVKEKLEINAGASVEFLDTALMEIENNRCLSPVGTEIQQIFEPVTKAKTILQISPSKLEQYLSNYESMSGYVCAAVLTEDGQFVAGHTRGHIGRDAFVASVQRILTNILDSARKMDIGAFVNGEIETPVGRLRLASWKNVVLAFLADQPAKKEDIDEAVEKFVAFASVK